LRSAGAKNAHVFLYASQPCVLSKPVKISICCERLWERLNIGFCLFCYEEDCVPIVGFFNGWCFGC